MIAQTGPISMGDVLAELRVANPGRQPPISLNDPDVRALAGVPSGPISLANFYGKSAASAVPSWSMSFGNATSTKGVHGASLTVSGDGSVTSQGNGAGPSASWYWPHVANVGTGYWVKFASSGPGTWSGATRGTLYNIGTGSVAINVNSTSATADNTGTIIVSIYRDSAGTQLVSTGTANYEVGWTGL
jgi:hypothetical protein